MHFEERVSFCARRARERGKFDAVINNENRNLIKARESIHLDSQSFYFRVGASCFRASFKAAKVGGTVTKGDYQLFNFRDQWCVSQKIAHGFLVSR